MAYSYQRQQPNLAEPEVVAKLLKKLSILNLIYLPKPSDAWLRLIAPHPSNRGFRLDNGMGDTIDLLFSDGSAFIKGFDHESPLNQFSAEDWDTSFFDNSYAGVPENFLASYEDEEELDYMTFCIWYDKTSKSWQQNICLDVDDDSDFLLSYLEEDPIKWIDWAKTYFSRDIDDNLVHKVYQGEELTASDLSSAVPSDLVEVVLAAIADLDKWFRSLEL